MNLTIRKYNQNDITSMIHIWNEIIEAGNAFPQKECLTVETGRAFFQEQTYCAVAENTIQKRVDGFYILHPNNIGRCGHIGNATYAVHRDRRGQHIGEKLVLDSLVQAKKAGFSILQFNAVVASNRCAKHLYERLGFQSLGMIPGGFHMKDGHYESIYLYYKVL